MKYTHSNILGLHLRQMIQLRKLTRAELFTRLQLIRTVEPIVDRAFRISEEKVLQQNLDSEPHGQPWHVSFHASQFPGDDPMACARKSLYRMMDFPASDPVTRQMRQTGDSGKTFEATLVEAWARSEMLLSSSDPNNQTGFEYPEAWLTGSVDAVILPPGWNKPLPVEVKERKAEVVNEMRLGIRGPYPEHISQVKVEVAFTRRAQELGILWADLDPCTHGVIYYGSRDDPLTTAEFRVDHDENFWVAGIEKLKRWRTYFEEDVLPELDPGKRSSKFGHPNGWRWSKQPCAWCDWKLTCQLDFRENVTQLSKSIGIERAQKIRPDYDLETARLRVRARWQARKDQKQEA